MQLLASARLCNINRRFPSKFDTVALTDITIDIQLDIGIVGPHESVDGVGEILEEEPEAQEREA